MHFAGRASRTGGFWWRTRKSYFWNFSQKEINWMKLKCFQVIDSPKIGFVSCFGIISPALSYNYDQFSCWQHNDNIYEVHIKFIFIFHLVFKLVNCHCHSWDERVTELLHHSSAFVLCLLLYLNECTITRFYMIEQI